MLTRFFLILSLLVFLSLLISGSSVEPALIKMAAVFFALVAGLVVCRSLIPIIREETQNDQESTPSHNSA